MSGVQRNGTTSIFAPKAAPRGVISAANDYASMCKFVMKQRLLRVLIFSLILNWVFLTVCSTWSFTSLLSFGHMTLSGISFALVVLPPLVYHKQALSPLRPLEAPPRSNLISRVFHFIQHPKTWRFAGLSTLCGFINAFLFSRLDQHLGVFAPTHRYPFHLNESFCIFAFSNFMVGVLYGTSYTISTRSQIRWPTIIAPPSLSTIIPFVTPRAIEAILLGLSSTITSIILALFFRRTVYSFLLWIFGGITRHYITHFLHPRAQTPFTIHNILWMASANVATALMWDVSQSLLDFYSSLLLTVSQFAPSPNQALVSGIHSPNPYIQHQALRELSVLAASTSPLDSARRNALLGDLKFAVDNGGPTPGMWAALCRQCLLILGKDLQTLKARGKSTPSKPAVTPAPPPKPTAPAKPFDRSIYRPTSPSTREVIVDSLSSEGATTRVASDLVASVSSSRIPQLFLGEGKTTSAVVPKKPAPANPKPGFDLGKEVKAFLNTAFPPDLRRNMEQYSLYHTLFEKGQLLGVAQASLPNCELDCWAIQSLAYVASNSREEDKYGVVQRDIPKVLEAFVTFLGALEALISDLEKGRKPLTPAPTSTTAGDAIADPRIEWEETEWRQVEEVCILLRDALREGIHVIVATFRDRMSVFKFPVSTAERLQEIVNR